jgi:hypothetical protein
MRDGLLTEWGRLNFDQINGIKKIGESGFNPSHPSS